MQLAALFASVSSTSVVGHLGSVSFARVLAHQGGWDEILMVLVPVSVFAVLLYVANRRAADLAAREDGHAGSDGAGSEGAESGGDGPADTSTKGDGSRDPGDARPRPTTPRNRRGGPI